MRKLHHMHILLKLNFFGFQQNLSSSFHRLPIVNRPGLHMQKLLRARRQTLPGILLDSINFLLLLSGY